MVSPYHSQQGFLWSMYPSIRCLVGWLIEGTGGPGPKALLHYCMAYTRRLTDSGGLDRPYIGSAGPVSVLTGHGSLTFGSPRKTSQIRPTNQLTGLLPEIRSALHGSEFDQIAKMKNGLKDPLWNLDSKFWRYCLLVQGIYNLNIVSSSTKIMRNGAIFTEHALIIWPCSRKRGYFNRVV